MLEEEPPEEEEPADEPPDEPPEPPPDGRETALPVLPLLEGRSFDCCAESAGATLSENVAAAAQKVIARRLMVAPDNRKVFNGGLNHRLRQNGKAMDLPTLELCKPRKTLDLGLKCPDADPGASRNGDNTAFDKLAKRPR